MTLINQTDAPHDFLESFLKAHETEDPENPRAIAQGMFDGFFARGYVFKGPDFMLLGGDVPGITDETCWYVGWAEVSPGLPRSFLFEKIRMFLSLMPEYRPYIKWARGLRGRDTIQTFSTDRLLRLTRHEEPKDAQNSKGLRRRPGCG